MEHNISNRIMSSSAYLGRYITTEAGFRFQTEFKTEVNLSIGLKPYFIV